MIHDFNQEVLDALPPLAPGSHTEEDAAVCAMEALARACGYGTTDSPECASSVIRAFTVRLNDNLATDAERDTYIRPLLPLMVGTDIDGYDLERLLLCADYAVRVFAPLALEAADRPARATQLRRLPRIVSAPIADIALATVGSLRAAVGAAAAMQHTNCIDACYLALRAAEDAAYAVTVPLCGSAARYAAQAAMAAQAEQAAHDLLKELCLIGKVAA